MDGNDRDSLEALEFRLRTILPEEYQDTYEEVQPVSMGSAGLKYDADGQVAWDEIWDTFCDLAMAGGPPHKGTLLEPSSSAEIEAQPDRYREVVREICRGVTMVTGLTVDESPAAGWCRVGCDSEAMAEWLLRAIVMENVAATAEETLLNVPAGPGFRLEKEIKNVVTVVAKTCHYWLGHMPASQMREIAGLFAQMAEESPLIVPAESIGGVRTGAGANRFAALAERIHRDTGLRPSDHVYAGWLGVECPSVGAAIWMMRALVVSNVLSRREGTALFVPLNPVSDPGGVRVARSLARIHRFAVARGVL